MKRKITHKLIQQIILMLIIGAFSSCIDESYDLSEGLNTDMTIGGDSLTMPLAKSKVYLDSMLSSQQCDMLKKLADSTYAFNMVDSMTATVNGIKPIAMAFNPISVSPIGTSFSSISLPEFVIGTTSTEAALNVPKITIDKGLLQPITSSYTQDFLISAPSGVKNSSNSNKANSATVTVGPYSKVSNNSFSESFTYLFPSELKKINTIYFSNTKVTMTFDKTKTNQLGLSSQNDTIKEFRIDFPTDFKLSSPTGMNAGIEGSSFVIRNAALTKNVNVFTASFIIESLDLTSYYQLQSMIYSKTVNYSINYKFIGTTTNITPLIGKNVEYTVGIAATPVISDAEIVTNPFTVTLPDGEIAINKDITGIPSEVAQLSSVTFNRGANLQLNVVDPNIYPFSFTAGQCQITLPQTFNYNAYSGLNTSSKTLTLSYSNLFGTKNIGVSGATLNKTFAENQTSFNLSDKIKYSTYGLTVGGQTTNLSTLQGLGAKLLKMSGTGSGLTVKDASLTTRRISVDLAQKTTPISISKFVSTDVKRLFTASLKTSTSINFGITVSNLPTNVDSLFFENYTITLPSYLKFKTGDVNSQNQVILNRGFKVSNGFSKTLTLEKIDFGTDGKLLTNGTFSLSDAVSMGGKIYAKGTNLSVSQLGTITVKPTITVGTINLSVIEGEITPALPTITKIKTTTLPAFLEQDGAILDLQNPVITMEIGNSLGIPIEATVNIVPKKNCVAISGGSVSGKATIPAATLIGQTSWTHYLISKNSQPSTSYQNIVIESLPNLFKIAPDEIDIIVTPVVSGTKQTVDLYAAKSQVDIKYAINVPLDLGSNFKVQYNDTITNLQSRLAEIIKYAREVNISTVFENKIPLNMAFEAIPLDINNKTLTGITVTSTDSIKPCNIDGTASQSTVKLNIKETTTGALDKLNAVRFKITATKSTTIAALPLKTSQYFIMDIKVMIPDGLTLSFAK
jgi:hypothetical protein